MLIEFSFKICYENIYSSNPILSHSKNTGEQVKYWQGYARVYLRVWETIWRRRNFSCSFSTCVWGRSCFFYHHSRGWSEESLVKWGFDGCERGLMNLHLIKSDSVRGEMKNPNVTIPPHLPPCPSPSFSLDWCPRFVLYVKDRLVLLSVSQGISRFVYLPAYINYRTTCGASNCRGKTMNFYFVSVSSSKYKWLKTQNALSTWKMNSFRFFLLEFRYTSCLHFTITFRSLIYVLTTPSKKMLFNYFCGLIINYI